MPVSQIGSAGLASGGVAQTNVGSGVAGTGPAFSAYQSSAQTLSSVTATKIQFQTEEFDTNNNFASSTFTPTVAGYYIVCAAVRTASSATTVRPAIYKNGGQYKIGGESSGSSQGHVSTIVFCNGTTDFIETYALFVTGQNTSAGISDTWFNGAMVRSA
jgi:hypothetical protein